MMCSLYFANSEECWSTKLMKGNANLLKQPILVQMMMKMQIVMITERRMAHSGGQNRDTDIVSHRYIFTHARVQKVGNCFVVSYLESIDHKCKTYQEIYMNAVT